MASIEQIKQLVKNRQVPRVLALGGSEQALMDDALALLRAHHQGDDPDGINHHRHDAGAEPFSTIISTLQTPPFLAKSRLVEISHAEKLDSNDVVQFLSYVKNPAPFSVLVVLFSKIDKRNKLYAALLEQKVFFSAEVDEKELAAYVQSEAKNFGMKIDNEVSLFLLMAFENDLLATKNALKKLSLIFENTPVSLEDAALHVGGTGMQDVFKLARAISEGDIKVSLKTLAVIREKENVLQFLGVLIWQFRVLLHIRHCLDRGMNEWDIRQEVSVYGDRFAWMLRVAKKRPMLFHINRLTRLIKCDTALKTQKFAEPFNVIERIVYQSALGS